MKQDNKYLKIGFINVEIIISLVKVYILTGAPILGVVLKRLQTRLGMQ